MSLAIRDHYNFFDSYTVQKCDCKFGTVTIFKKVVL